MEFKVGASLSYKGSNYVEEGIVVEVLDRYYRVAVRQRDGSAYKYLWGKDNVELYVKPKNIITLRVLTKVLY